jgi:hypothetical protein
MKKIRKTSSAGKDNTQTHRPISIFLANRQTFSQIADWKMLGITDWISETTMAISYLSMI